MDATDAASLHQAWPGLQVREVSLPKCDNRVQPIQRLRLLETQSADHNKNLVVVLHGLDFRHPLPGPKVNCDRLHSFLRQFFVREEGGATYALTDLLLVDYPNHLWVDAKTAKGLSVAISNAIGQAHLNHRSNGYNNIILLGHSFGSLLARRVIVDATERRKEHPDDPEVQWCMNANGLISLAGTNLGFKIGKTNSVPLHIFSRISGFTNLLAPWLVDLLSSRARIGKLASHCWRNSPWVVDTRIKWLRLYEGEDRWRGKEALVKYHGFKTLSITGTQDALVGEDDQEMVYQLGDFVCTRTLENLRHEGFLDTEAQSAWNAYKNGENATYDPRTDIEFILSCSDRNLPNGWKEVTRVSSLHAPSSRDAGQERTVIFLIHGIRDNAEWQEDIDYNLRKIHNQQHPTEKIPEESPKPSIQVSQIRYGYFSALQFLFPSQRKQAIRSFSDEYLRVMARFPDLKQENIHVYAHSNGTFLFGEALRKFSEIKVNRVLLGGSVLPPGFPWRKLVNPYPMGAESEIRNTPTGHQVMEILNYAANKDAPTGLLCRGLSFLRLPFQKQPPLLGIGAAGTDGFRDLCNFQTPGRPGVVRGWNFFLEGDHGATLATGHQSPKGIARYLLGAGPGECKEALHAPYSFNDLNKRADPTHPLERPKKNENENAASSYSSLYRGLHGNFLAGAALAIAGILFLFLIGFPPVWNYAYEHVLAHIPNPPAIPGVGPWPDIDQFWIFLNAIFLMVFLYILSRF